MEGCWGSKTGLKRRRPEAARAAPSIKRTRSASTKGESRILFSAAILLYYTTGAQISKSPKINQAENSEGSK